MDEELELEIVELGDAKEETRGIPQVTTTLEEGSDFLYRQPD